MVDPADNTQEDFAVTREHEYQDAHYHDEEPDVANDETLPAGSKPAPAKKKKRIPPPPKPRHYED